MEAFHTPVLLHEVLEYLDVRPGGKYIDATLGGGGHTAAILERGGTVLGVDRDPAAVTFARDRLEKLETGNWRLATGNFGDISRIARGNGFYPVAGVLYDLGMSSWQIEKSGRGFSFQRDEPLDMRMSSELAVTAADLVNALSENELTKLFTRYGEERRARRFARAIAHDRRVNPIKTSRELADLIRRLVPSYSRTRRDPATKVFQALRIAVNDELNALRSSLPRALELLAPGGRLVVISFHSLEDRIVKEFMSEAEKSRRGRMLTKKPIRPLAEEVKENPRARSAKLRALEKLNDD